MKFAESTAVVSAALLVPALANPLFQQRQLDVLARRAFDANAPDGYTPQTVSCPSATPTVRSAQDLSQNETAWLSARRNATIQPMQDLLQRLNITGLDTTKYINDHKNNASSLPVIGIAVSGGGYRAMFNGAGVLQAFDSRTPNSTSHGQVGGVLQSATYLSGLSGGSWLVGSLYSNNFTSISDILGNDTSASNSGSLWQVGNSIFEGPASSGSKILNSANYYSDLIDQVKGKHDAGFNTTITDYWGRALSYQLINATDGGPGFTFSSIAQQDWFTQGTTPLPLIVTDGRNPGQVIASSNSTIFSIDPWEIGSNDPTLYGFAPLHWVGSNFANGKVQGDQCVVGFDSASFVMGTSSSLFNEALVKVNGANSSNLFSQALQSALSDVLSDVADHEDDIASWTNPFYGYNNGSNPNAAWRNLTLVDGGEDNQNVPLTPLLQPNRHVDVIFAVDSSADTNPNYPNAESGANWPAGVSLIATYERSLSKIANGTAFPAVPDKNTFVNNKLNTKPVFFGCDPANTTSPTPLIVYLPNAPYAYDGNTSTYQLTYEDNQRNGVIFNGYMGATQGNGTLDSQWGTCLGCAILNRSLNRTGTPMPAVCTQCFSRYCWNGKTNSSAPGTYDPAIYLPNNEFKTKSAAGRISTSVTLAVSVALAAGFAML